MEHYTKNTIQKILIEKLAKTHPNAVDCFKEIIKEHPEIEEQVLNIAQALKIDIDKIKRKIK